MTLQELLQKKQSQSLQTMSVAEQRQLMEEIRHQMRLSMAESSRLSREKRRESDKKIEAVYGVAG